MGGRLKDKISKTLLQDTLDLANYNIRKTAELLSETIGEPIQSQNIDYWVKKYNLKQTIDLGREQIKISADSEPKILLFDIETAPIKAYVWGLWKQNISLPAIIKDWYVLCWSAKFLNEDKVYHDALCFHEGYVDEDDCEFNVIESIWNLLDACDIAVAQNGKKFDKKKLNAKFLQYGFPEPTYKVVDTLLIAKGNFAFSSNKLDHMTKLLSGEGKNKTDYSLWTGCMNGDKKAWDTMVEYCDQDVRELETVYLGLRAWDKNHPSYGMYQSGELKVCNVCGSSSLDYDGDYRTATSTFEVFMCNDCGHKQRTRKNLKLKTKETMVNVR